MSLKTSIHTQFLVLLYIDFYTIIISDFGLFVGLKFTKFCQNIQFIVVINKRTHYISHSSPLPHIYLFFIKSMTNFDKYRLTFSVKNGKRGSHMGLPFLYSNIVLAILYFALLSDILLIYNLFLYSLNYFADVHIVRFPAFFASLSIHRRIGCVIFLYAICQMSFIKLMFIQFFTYKC